MDENYERVMVSAADVSKEKGIPQAFYLENVMPTPHGYQAIGYDQVAPAFGVATDFDKAFPIQNSDLNKFIYVPAAGKNYVYDANNFAWKSCSPLPVGKITSDTLVTTAFIQGQSYIFIQGVGCFIYNSATQALDAQVFTGIDINQVLGICAANGYMIVWTANSIAWSSTTNPLLFTPSLITGAGGSGINDAKGAIIVCLPIANGFIVYCEKNAVGAKYTGNIALPYAFYELSGSGGITSPEAVSWQANLGYHFAWTTFGLQQLDLSGNNAQFVFPEVTTFLSGLIYETFDTTTLQFTTTYLSTPVGVKLTVTEDSFLIISYGLAGQDFTYAIICDLSLGRWGKVKITHRDAFQWNTPNLHGPLTYGLLIQTTYGNLINTTYGQLSVQQTIADAVRKTLAFLQQDGTVKVINFDMSETTANGVLLLGKYQLTRNRRILHQTSEIEVLNPALPFSFYVLPTYDGKTFVTAKQGIAIPVPGAVASAKTRRYGAMIEGQNVSLMFMGAFNLTSVVTDFTQGGAR